MPYDWFDRELEDRAAGEFWDEFRRSEKRAREAEAARRNEMAQTWDPRTSGWETAPSSEWRDRWIRELGHYRGYAIRDHGDECRADSSVKVPGYRQKMPVMATFDSLAECVKAIDSGSIVDRLEPNFEEWDPPSQDLADRAYQGGAPGLGRRGRGKRR